MKKLISLLLASALFLGAFSFAYADSNYFADVTSGWARGPVNRAFAEGVVNGTGFDGSGQRLYTPDGPLTYAAFITIMARKFLPEDMAVRSVPPETAEAIGAGNLNKWWAPAYYTTLKNGLLLKEVSPEVFSTQTITRKEMAYVVYTIAGLAGFGESVKVTDEEIESVPDIVYAAEGENLNDAEIYMIVIAACYKLGIIQGVDAEGNFNPGGSVKRSQAAAIYCRAEDAFASGADRLPGGDSVYAVRYSVLERVNEERAKEGRAPLVFDSMLQAAADVRVKEVMTEGNFAHKRPDGSDCFTAIEDIKRFRRVGENIAGGATDAKSVMDAWMESEGHRTNILSPNFNSIGIGVAYDEGSQYGYNWVQMFGGKAE